MEKAAPPFPYFRLRVRGVC
uniref:Uncharacterized protein n=1 Tax=Arundo donax TaxID=35708 RepID=A0A0A8ZQ35_ARUDO